MSQACSCRQSRFCATKGDESASCAQFGKTCLRQRTTQNDGGLSYRVRNFWLGARYFPRIPHGRARNMGVSGRIVHRSGVVAIALSSYGDMHRTKTLELHFPLANRNSLGRRRNVPVSPRYPTKLPIRHRHREYRRHAYACRCVVGHARHIAAQLRQSTCDLRLCGPRVLARNLDAWRYRAWGHRHVALRQM